MRIQVRPTQAVAILAALSIAAIVITTALLLWQLRAREREHSRLETISLAEMFIDQSQQNVHSADEVLRGIQERIHSPFGRQIPLDGDLTHLLLATRIGGMRQLHAAWLVNAQGEVINSSGARAPGKVSAATSDYFEHFSQASRDQLFIGKPVRDPGDGRWILRLARPLAEPGEAFQGVIVVALDIAALEQNFYHVKLDFVRPVAVYRRDGTLLASMPHRENDIGAPALELDEAAVASAGSGVKTLVHHSGDGVDQTFALGRIANYPLLLSVTDDENQSLASWREIAVPIVLAVVLVSAFTFFLAGYLIDKLRRKAILEAALQDADDRYMHTVESVKDAIVAIDSAHRIRLFNPAAQAMFGYPAAEAIGAPLGLLLPEAALPRHAAKVQEFSKTTEGPRAMAGQLEIFGKRRDGSQFPIESSISKTHINGELQMTAVLRDVTQQRANQRALEALNQELRALYASQQTVREIERTRISRELHDDLGQQLTGLKLSLAWLGNRIKEGRAPEVDRVDSMRHMLDTAITSVRRISSELRPQILDELGFAEALSWQLREFAKQSGLELEMHLPARDRVQDAELATTLFRIGQEAMTNAVRHAHAKKVCVDLLAHDGGLRFSVRDDGTGMAQDAQPSGIGLIGMRERARMVGGLLRIQSTPGFGTLVEITIPADHLGSEPLGTPPVKEAV